ncbi:class I SAM-dependent methyltransferase [Candidatus Dojkabacteria bacterium]|jgi:2-polyprenyl-3-methyl-5-hydroxy-6-metoxy-1,4-benzoquinol methylase|nr:class I SAM-dependent methyltransferase [Candidatus Dojkabacteria bacterium]
MAQSTRGTGKLEYFLFLVRYRIVKRIIGNKYKDANILDIGCGSNPLFLKKISANYKCGIDKTPSLKGEKGLNIISQDLVRNCKLPFHSSYFHVVTALAFIEHIYCKEAESILKEAKRVLKNGGILVVTTPAKWTNSLLVIMSKLNLISKEEINEHKELYSKRTLKRLLISSGFKNSNIKIDSFLFMNLFAVVKK